MGPGLRDSIRSPERVIGNYREGSTLDPAHYARDPIIPPIAQAREAADKLACVVSDEFWPLPAHQEMLFVGKPEKDLEPAGPRRLKCSFPIM